MNNQFTICDTSILINFLRINRMDLFKKCPFSFFITEHVQEEITVLYPNQYNLLEVALSQNMIQKLTISNSLEFEIFTKLIKTGQLGAGECAAIAAASCRDCYLAMDDKQAIKKAKEFISENLILRTQDLVVLMIQEHILEIDEADKLIQIWANEHRFKLKIKSFGELSISMK